MNGLPVEDARTSAGTNGGVRRPRRVSAPFATDGKPPAVLLLTRDPAFRALVTSACESCCRVAETESCDACLETVLNENIDLVVVDDGALPADEREWFMRRVSRLVPQPSIIYVASRHSAEVEREARACGAAYYTSKPVEAQSMDEVLHTLVRHLRERNHIACCAGGGAVSQAHRLR